MTHRQAKDIPYKCSVEGCPFATNQEGKIRSHLWVAHNLKLLNEDDVRQYYTGTGKDIPSRDLTVPIQVEQQDRRNRSWKTVTSDKEIQEVRSRHNKTTKYHTVKVAEGIPTSISPTSKEESNGKKRLTITAYTERQGRIQRGQSTRGIQV